MRTPRWSGSSRSATSCGSPSTRSRCTMISIRRLRRYLPSDRSRRKNSRRWERRVVRSRTSDHDDRDHVGADEHCGVEIVPNWIRLDVESISPSTTRQVESSTPTASSPTGRIQLRKRITITDRGSSPRARKARRDLTPSFLKGGRATRHSTRSGCGDRAADVGDEERACT